MASNFDTSEFLEISNSVAGAFSAGSLASFRVGYFISHCFANVSANSRWIDTIWTLIIFFFSNFSLRIRICINFLFHFSSADNVGQRKEAIPRDGREGQGSLRFRNAKLCATERSCFGPWQEAEANQRSKCTKTIAVSTNLHTISFSRPNL